MSSHITLAPGLAELDSRLRAPGDEADLAQVLRALQRLRLSEADLRVHIERLRAYNDATDQDEDFEENCLLALDLVTGYARNGLRWDAATMAPILLGVVLDRQALEAGCVHAVRPNDLLPPRPYDLLPQDISNLLVDWTNGHLHSDAYGVGPADIFRTPKSPFTTRPAALLALPDRLALEALAELISSPLDQLLPPSVLWPRGRTSDHANDVSMKYRSRPLEWGSNYIVKADIVDFYGTVDHAILGLVTSTHLDMPRKYGQAVESLLSALMDIDRGLPQGVPASDVFASAFLLPIDAHLSEDRMIYIRNGDDYYFPADSLDDARRTLRHLEENLRGIGLSLNDEKTSTMLSSTYRKGLTDHTLGLGNLIQQLKHSHEELAHIDEASLWPTISGQFEAEEEEEEEDFFEEVFDPFWDHLYGGELTLIDVIEGLRETLQHDIVEAYELLLSALALELKPEPSVDIRKAEDLGRQCLAFLTADERAVPLENIKVLLEWFPKLAPNVSMYLSSIAETAQNGVSRFVVDALDLHPKSDWITGWILAAIAKPGLKLNSKLIRLLNSVAADKTEGLLTRTSAVRALAVAHELSESTWYRLGSDATPAVQSEMVFSALFDPEQYPWPIQFPAIGVSSPMRELKHRHE